MPYVNGDSQTSATGAEGTLENHISTIEPCHFPSLSLHKDTSTRENVSSSFGTCESHFNISQDVEVFCRETGIPFIRFYYAAWAVILSCFVGSKSVCFASLSEDESGSADPNTVENGYSANLEVMAYNLDDSAPVRKLLELGSLNDKFSEHSDADVNQSLKRIEKSRGISQWNTAISRHQHIDSNNLEAPQILLMVQTEPSRTSSGSKLRMVLKYSHKLLDENSAPRVLRSFTTALVDIASNPDQLQGELNLVSEVDVNQLWEWNPSLPPDFDAILMDAFDQRVTAQPHHPAIYSWDGCFTYKELDDMALKLAFHLHSKGVKPDDVIPICLDKSKFVPVAVLGAWKAGAAVTLQDPSHPVDRRKMIIEDTDASIIITEKKYVPDFEDLKVFLVSDIEALCSEQRIPSAPISTGVTSKSLAYIGFSSGSTGRPKGILHTHSSIYAYTALGSTQNLVPESHLLQFASYAFLPGFLEITRCLFHGSTLYILSEAQRSGDVAKYLRDHKITQAFFTPSFLRSMVLEEIPQNVQITIGGEMIDQGWLKNMRKTHDISQGYGMTEGIKIMQSNDSPYVGLRQDGCAAWITIPDDLDRLAPIGSVGELLVEGPYTFVGYLNDPNKTSATLPNRPLWSTNRDPSRRWRIIRTGDLAKYNSDGSITIVGRWDTQVKIHGQRVELGDIEFHIRKNLPAGTEVVVELIKPSDAKDRPLLTAIMVLPQTKKSYSSAHAKGNGEHVGQEQLHLMVPSLKANISRALPKYMVPTLYLSRAEMPVNASNKIDRKKLRDEYGALSLHEFQCFISSNEEKTSLRTEAEKYMQSLWAKILQLDDSFIGRDDDFFGLGGDSLLVIKLIAQARHEGFELSSTDVFMNPVLSTMSTIIREVHTNGYHQEEDKISPKKEVKLPPWFNKSNIEGIYEATDWQTWVALAGSLKTHGWIDYLMYDLHGPVDEEWLFECCKKLLDHHGILRTSFVTDEGKTYQVVIKDLPLRKKKYEAKSSEEFNRITDQIIKEDLPRHLVIGQPYTSFVLIQASPSEFRLMLRISHAQYDAMCVALIAEQLQRAYNGQDFLQTPTFSEYLNITRSSTSTDDATEFWRERMKDAVIPKLVERSESDGPAYCHSTTSEITKTVEDPRLNGRGITAAVVVKAAWATVLASITNTRDVTFGDLVSGRNAPLNGVEKVIGPCMNFLPFRINLDELYSSKSSQPTVIDLLKFAQEKQLGAISHEAKGFRHIIEECTPWPKWERFSSIINYVNVAQEDPISKVKSWGKDGGVQQINVKGGYRERSHDKTDIWLMILPTTRDDGASALEITMRFSEDVIERAKCEAILDLYCRTIDDFSKWSDELFVLPELPSSGPDIAAPIGKFIRPHDGDLTDPSEIFLSQHWQNADIAAAELAVDEVWWTVFGESKAASMDAEARFYDIWGDMIIASQMQLEYYLKGVFIDVEGIIAHPSVRAQKEVIASALGEGKFR